MQKAPIPEFEQDRLEALKKMGILDTKQEERFDKITREAAEKLNVPISAISIIDDKREWFKSCHGLDFKESPRDISFCGHALLSDQMFVVEDTLKDERFTDNPHVIGKPFVRFYAGIRLFDRQKRQPIGVFCVKDTKPRKLSISEIGTIIELGNKSEEELNK